MTCLQMVRYNEYLLMLVEKWKLRSDINFARSNYAYLFYLLFVPFSAVNLNKFGVFCSDIGCYFLHLIIFQREKLGLFQHKFCMILE